MVLGGGSPRTAAPTGGRSIRWLVAAAFLGACTSPSQSVAPTSTFATTTTSIVTVTTAEPPTTTSTPSSAPLAPSIVVPRRPLGLDGLDLDEADLSTITTLTASVVRVLPHDRTAVTEALALRTADELVESTGFYGRSSRRRIDLTDGSLIVSHTLAPELYATGLALLGEDSFQFTRREELVERFDSGDLSLLDEQRIGDEVVGACGLDGVGIVTSSPAGDLTIVEPDGLAVARTLTPALNDRRLPGMTDLSCADGTIWGVLGDSGSIAQVSAETGELIALADLSGLTPAGLAESDVLSGLAYRTGSDTWFVTGKRWDVLYEISLS